MPSVSAWPAISTETLRQETTPRDLPFVLPTMAMSVEPVCLPRNLAAEISIVASGHTILRLWQSLQYFRQFVERADPPVRTMTGMAVRTVEQDRSHTVRTGSTSCAGRSPTTVGRSPRADELTRVLMGVR